MENQVWKVIRTKSENPLVDPPQTLILFNGQAVGFVQSYSFGQSTGNSYETLLLEIACPSLELEVVSKEELAPLLKELGLRKYGQEDASPNKEDLEFAEKLLSAESENSDLGS